MLSITLKQVWYLHYKMFAENHKETPFFLHAPTIVDTTTAPLHLIFDGDATFYRKLKFLIEICYMC